MLIPSPQFVVHGAARHTQLFPLKSRPFGHRVTTLPPPGALSKLAESSGKALHGQGGPVEQVGSIEWISERQHCLRVHEALRKVHTARMKRIAPPNPLDAAPRAPDRAVLANGLNEIIAARRLKTALAAYQRAQRPLIDSRRPNQQRAGQMPNLSSQAIHERLPPLRRKRWSILS